MFEVEVLGKQTYCWSRSGYRDGRVSETKGNALACGGPRQSSRDSGVVVDGVPLCI